MNRRASALFTAVITLVMAMGIAGCGGGGTLAPDPGLQQPPPGQQPPPEQQPPPGQQLPPSEPVCESPDASKITAYFNTHILEFEMAGDPGAVRPGANIVIEDSQSFVATTTAGPDGSFIIIDADVPPNFMKQVGAPIDVMQFTPDTQRSDPCTVFTQAIN